MITLLLTALLLCGDPAASNKPPSALYRMESARQAIRAMETIAQYHDYKLPESLEPLNDLRFLFDSVGEQVAYNEMGNDAGAVALSTKGGTSSISTGCLIEDPNTTWVATHGAIVAKRFIDDGGDTASRLLSDFRYIGNSPLEPTMPGRVSTLIANNPDATYSEEMQGGLHVVTMTLDTPQGNRSYTWYIDPAKNWNAERIERSADGRLIGRTEYALRDYNGIWFPERAVTFDATGNRCSEWVFANTYINDPALPEKPTPEDVGVYPGAAVYTSYGPGKEGTKQRYLGNGVLVDEEEFFRLAKEGKTTVDPRILAPEQVRPQPFMLDPWEKYKNDFDAKYKLTGDQRAVTEKICRESIERRRRLEVKVHREEAKREAIETLFKEYTERLERIPTRAQFDNCTTQPLRPPMTSRPSR